MICKYCNEEIADGAIKCKHCKSMQNAPSAEYYCSSCGALMKREAAICLKCGVKNKNSTSKKNKTIAGVFALLLGGFGIHKFYLGRIGQGIFYVLFCWTYIPSIIAFIEGIIYLVSSEESFDSKYN